MPTALELKFIARIQHRMLHTGSAQALTYAVGVTGQLPHIVPAILSAMQEPFKTVLNAAINGRLEIKEQKKQLAIQLALEQETLLANQQAVLATQRAILKTEFRASTAKARHIGEVVVYLAGLNAVERSYCGATKSEICDAILMRKACLRSTQVKDILQCSTLELKRWSDDGRLPVLFRRRTRSESAGKMLEVRHWHSLLVDKAIGEVEVWRKEDKYFKRLHRTTKA